MTFRSGIAAATLCALGILGGLPASAAGEPAVVVQYSGGVPDAAEGSAASLPQPPAVARAVFSQVPEREAHPLAQIAISPQLAGGAGIAGLTVPPHNGGGGVFDQDDVTPDEALLEAAGSIELVLTLGLGILLLAAFVANRRLRSTRLPPG